jgi:hypothetical protein
VARRASPAAKWLQSAIYNPQSSGTGGARFQTWGLDSIETSRGIDFNVTTEQRLLRKPDYCRANPVKRGLVDRREDWPWSSYRYYELDDSSVLKIDRHGV